MKQFNYLHIYLILIFCTLNHFDLDAKNACVKLFEQKQDNYIQYPKLYRRLQNLSRTLDHEMVQDQIYSVESMESNSDWNRPFRPEDLPSNTELKEKLRLAYNTLHNLNFIKDYIQQLAEDSVKEISKLQIDKELEQLRKKGTISRNALLRVLVRRFAFRGQNIGVVTFKSGKDFHEVGKKGPFFDKTISHIESDPWFSENRKKEFKLSSEESEHGMDSHLIQLDIISAVFNFKTEKHFVADFYSLLFSTEDAANSLRATLIDAPPFQSNDFTSPVTIIRYLNPIFSNK